MDAASLMPITAPPPKRNGTLSRLLAGGLRDYHCPVCDEAVPPGLAKMHARNRVHKQIKMVVCPSKGSAGPLVSTMEELPNKRYHCESCNEDFTESPDRLKTASGSSHDLDRNQDVSNLLVPECLLKYNVEVTCRICRTVKETAAALWKHYVSLHMYLFDIFAVIDTLISEEHTRYEQFGSCQDCRLGLARGPGEFIVHLVACHGGGSIDQFTLHQLVRKHGRPLRDVGRPSYPDQQSGSHASSGRPRNFRGRFSDRYAQAQPICQHYSAHVLEEQHHPGDALCNSQRTEARGYADQDFEYDDRATQPPELLQLPMKQEEVLEYFEDNDSSEPEEGEIQELEDGYLGEKRLKLELEGDDEEN